jgi:MFS family permease
VSDTAAAEPAGVSALLRNRGFTGLLGYRLLALLSYQIVAVTVGWHVYEITHDAFALGLIGLAEVIPYFCFALFAGYAVDHLPRRKLGMAACIGLLTTTLALAGIAGGVLPAGIGRFGTLAIYAAIAVNGVVRAFLAPVYMSLFARVLKREQFPRGAGISSVVMQTGLVLGPALGGILVAWGGKTTAYLIAAIFAACRRHRRRHAACLRAPAARRTRAGVQEHWRGPALRLQHAGSSGGAGTGHVLGAVRRRGGSAAGLHQRDPAPWTGGPGAVARLARRPARC